MIFFSVFYSFNRRRSFAQRQFKQPRRRRSWSYNFKRVQHRKWIRIGQVRKRGKFKYRCTKCIHWSLGDLRWRKWGHGAVSLRSNLSNWWSAWWLCNATLQHQLRYELCRQLCPILLRSHGGRGSFGPWYVPHDPLRSPFSVPSFVFSRPSPCQWTAPARGSRIRGTGRRIRHCRQSRSIPGNPRRRRRRSSEWPRGASRSAHGLLTIRGRGWKSDRPHPWGLPEVWTWSLETLLKIRDEETKKKCKHFLCLHFTYHIMTTTIYIDIYLLKQQKRRRK